MFSGTMVLITGTGNPYGKACPCGKRSPGGSKVYRTGRLPLGERGGVPVREAFPWGIKQGVPVREAFPWGNERGVPCGKAPPGGTGRCARAGSIPLGEQARRTVQKKFPWGTKPRHTRAVPLGEQARCTVGPRPRKNQEKIKKNNICTHRCSFTSPRPPHISRSDSATSYASFILQQLELAQTELQVEVHQPITTVLPAPKSTIKLKSNV